MSPTNSSGPLYHLVATYSVYSPPGPAVTGNMYHSDNWVIMSYRCQYIIILLIKFITTHTLTEHTSETKVTELDYSVFTDKDIFRFDISMYYSMLMAVIDCL